MMRRLIVLAFLLLSCSYLLTGAAWGQRTNVTAQVKDTNGSLYVNCTFEVNFSPNPLQTQPYTISGSLSWQKNYPNGHCDSSANLSIGLFDTLSTVSPSDGQWRFTICSAPGYVPGNQFCFNATMPISGINQNITSNLTAVAPLLPISTGGGVGIFKVSTLPHVIPTGTLATVTDGTSSSDCTAGGGSTVAVCIFNGTTWVGVGATPGGLTTQVQVNSAGHFGGITSAGPGAVVLASGTSQLKWTTDVRDQGIDCSGVNDSTTAFQNMINAAPDYSSFTIPQNCVIKVSGTPAVTINQRAGLQFIGQGRSANFCGLTQSQFTYNQAYASGNTIFNINQSQQLLFQNLTVLVNGNADIAWNVDQTSSPPITTDNVWIDVCVRNAIASPNPAFRGFQFSKISASNVESMQLTRPWVQCANGPPTTSSSNGVGIWFGTSANQKDEKLEDAKFGNCSVGISFGGGSPSSGSDITIDEGLDSTSWINVQSGGFNNYLAGLRAEGVSGGTFGNVLQQTGGIGPYLLEHNDFAGRTVAAIDCPSGCAPSTLINNEGDTVFGNWFNAHNSKQGTLIAMNNRNMEFDPFDWAGSLVVGANGNLHGTPFAAIGAVASMPFQFTPNANDCGNGLCGSPLIDLEGDINAGNAVDPWYVQSSPNQYNNLVQNSTFYIVHNPSSTLAPWVVLQGSQSGAIYNQTVSPTVNNISIQNQGLGGSTTYSYVVVTHGATGTAPASGVASTTSGNATLTTNNSNKVIVPAEPGCTFFDIYRTACGGVGICGTNPTGKIGSLSCAATPNANISTFVSPEPTFFDTGLPGDGSTAPVTNTTGQVQSLVPTGLAPFSITSTTPVSNLTTVPATYNHSGTQQTNAHIVEDSGTMAGGTLTVTFSGSAIFTSSSSYVCTANDDTGIQAMEVVYNSGSSVTFNGNTTDTFRYVCIGN